MILSAEEMSLQLRIPLLVCIISAVKLAANVSIAPGDEEHLCQQLRELGTVSTPTYAPNMRILMDSFNYQNLLPVRIGAVWEQVDNDDMNPSGITTNVS